MQIEAIGLGLLISLFFSETLGLAAGGMVVPGYVALMLHHPLRILGTVGVSLATLGALKLLSRHMFIYGRRRIVVVVMLGFVFGWLSRQLLVLNLSSTTIELQSIGFIIPGLIANWMERQGITRTLCVMVMTAVVVRMFLMVFHGGEILA